MPPSLPPSFQEEGKWGLQYRASAYPLATFRTHHSSTRIHAPTCIFFPWGLGGGGGGRHPLAIAEILLLVCRFRTLSRRSWQRGSILHGSLRLAAGSWWPVGRTGSCHGWWTCSHRPPAGSLRVESFRPPVIPHCIWVCVMHHMDAFHPRPLPASRHTTACHYLLL